MSQIYKFFVLVSSFWIFSADGSLLVETLWDSEPAFEMAVREKIRSSAEDPDSYVSLGESHLFTPYSRPYLQSLAGDYFSNSSEPIYTCMEDLRAGETPLLAFLRGASSRFELTTGNTPLFTDFRRCEDPSSKHFFYSGFFHQFPIPRMFPQDFALTPVATEPGNTISTQISGHGVFVSAIDFAYVENQTTLALLREGLMDPSSFRSEARRLIDTVTRLKEKMSQLTGPVPLFGAFFGRDAIPAPETMEVMPEDAFLLLYDPAYRNARAGSLLFVDFLTRESDAWLTWFLGTYPANSRTFAAYMDFVDERTLAPVPFHFGEILEELPAQTEILQMRLGNRKFFLTASPSRERLRCFQAEAGDAAFPVNCD